MFISGILLLSTTVVLYTFLLRKVVRLIKKCLGFYLIEFKKELQVELLNVFHEKLVDILAGHGPGIDIHGDQPNLKVSKFRKQSVLLYHLNLKTNEVIF